METSVTERHGKKGHAGRGGHIKSQYDRDLIQAKIDGAPVGITLAVTTPYTDEDGYVVARVCHVDVYSVKFEINGKQRWISKAFIVSIGDPE